MKPETIKRVNGYANASHILYSTGLVDAQILTEYMLDTGYIGGNTDDTKLLSRLVEDGVITREQRKDIWRQLCHMKEPNNQDVVLYEQRLTRMRVSTIRERAQKILDKNNGSDTKLI